MSDHQHYEMLRELRNLIDQLCDGELNVEQVSRLEEIVCASPICSDYYVQAMEVHAGLACSSLPQISLDGIPAHAHGNSLAAAPKASRDAAPSTSPFPDLSAPAEFPVAGDAVSRFGSEWKSLMFFSFGVFMTLLVVIAWQFSGGNRDSLIVAHRSPQEITPAAYLMSANGCDWTGTTPRLQFVGSGVQVGDELSLNEGIAEFRLASGVQLSVEGPSSLVLASPSSLVLQYGKVTAHVPWTVTDFKVIAGACRFTACEAELGLLQEGNKVEVHVFSGAVQAESPRVVRETGGRDFVESGSLVVDDAGAFTKGTITAGNALTLISEGDVLKVAGIGQKAKPQNFAAKLSMAGALPVTKAYVDEVLASKPIGYWRFESNKDGFVTNEIPGGSDLKVVGKVRFAGSKENSSVEFQPKSGAYLISETFDDLASSDYAWEVWVKPSHLHRGEFLALIGGEENAATKPQSDHSSALELQGVRNESIRGKHPGLIRFVHYNPAKVYRGTSCYSKQKYGIRRWQHIVAVKEGAEMRLYVDGELSGTARDKTFLDSGLRLMLGWNKFNPPNVFVGQLDEVALYNRALTEKEVFQHYHAVQDAMRAGPESIPEMKEAWDLRSAPKAHMEDFLLGGFNRRQLAFSAEFVQ